MLYPRIGETHAAHGECTPCADDAASTAGDDENSFGYSTCKKRYFQAVTEAAQESTHRTRRSLDAEFRTTSFLKAICEKPCTAVKWFILSLGEGFRHFCLDRKITILSHSHRLERHGEKERKNEPFYDVPYVYRAHRHTKCLSLVFANVGIAASVADIVHRVCT